MSTRRERGIVGASPAGRRLVFRLEPDERSALPALAHGFGHALTHLQRPRSEDERRFLAEVGHWWRCAESFRCSASDATFELGRILSALGGAGTVEPGVVLPCLQRFRPPAPHRGVLPEARELVGLRAGLRRLVKWEADARSTHAMREAFESRGFVTCAASGGRGPLFASRDRDVLRAAVDAEARLHTPDEDAASRWIGEALGYPSCCIDGYLDQAARDDVSLALARLPLGVAEVGSAPPETLWLDGAASLLSHVPCSPWCEGSRALAARLCEAYESSHSGFVDTWREAASALHALDDEGEAWTLPDAPTGWAEAPALERARVAALWADHRG